MQCHCVVAEVNPGNLQLVIAGDCFVTVTGGFLATVSVEICVICGYDIFSNGLLRYLFVILPEILIKYLTVDLILYLPLFLRHFLFLIKLNL
jgi:hypothetical protein